MKVLGFDRIVIMVKDMEKALNFYSGKLGMDFFELDPEISKRDGVLSYICHDTHLHLISPILPLPENATPALKQQVHLLEQTESFLNAITFFVDDLEAVKEALEAHGHKILFKYEKTHDYDTIGLGGFEELVTESQTTFNTIMGFVQYEKCRGNIKKIEKDPNAVELTGLDRVIFMVHDMDRALDFFHGILGIEFKETAKETQEKAFNRGCVSLDHHLHLVQPYIPMPETAPPPLQQASKKIQEDKGMLSLVVYRTEDSKIARDKMVKMGYDVLKSWENDNDYASVGIKDLYEYLFDTGGKIGIPIVISKYD